eukprot:6529833-Pyramimonas_sp.AAC.1
MSRAVCRFGSSTSSAFGADLEDASSESLLLAPLVAQIARMSRAVCLGSSSGCHRKLQQAPGGPRRPQEVPGGIRRPQDATGRPQESPGGPRTHQEATGGHKRPQE